MKTPIQTIRKHARWLGLALAAVAIASPVANASVGRPGIGAADGTAPYASVNTRQPIAVADHSFSWADAGIGAATVIGVLLPLLGTTLLYHREAGSGEPIAVGGRANGSRKMKRDRNIKKRRRLARALERATVPERPCMRGPRYLVQPSVTAACAPSLQAIATALREEALVLDEAGLRAVLTFITDGRSPFFGRDATEALREAVRLQRNVVGAETAVLDQEPIAVAV